MNVLSLFDGMSCGQIALNRVGIKYDNYYASEIDKYAIKVAQQNYPNTIQLGDVTQVSHVNLPKIDLLFGGSPCQGFSFAGKQLNFEDPRSKLFFEFVRLKNELNPTYFLLENVRMKKESQDIISSYLGVEPITINSSLVSAQNRIRNYWTNIPINELPSDKGILLKDILENGVGASISQQGKHITNINQEKSHTLLARDYKGFGNQAMTGVLYNNSIEENIKCGAIRGIYDVDGVITQYEIKDVKYRKLTPLECERLQTLPDNYTNYVSNSQRYKMIGNGWTVDVIAHIFNNIIC